MNEKNLKLKVQIITVLAVCLLFTLIIATVGQLVTYFQLKRVNDKLTAEQNRLNSAYSSLAEEVEYKRSELYAEQYARELGLIKEGEKRYFIPDED